MKQLDRLVFAQGNRCYFCREILSKSDASVEHLVPSSRNGDNSDDNCVACCKSLNMLLGNKPLKEKIQIILNQPGSFKCPRALAGDQTQPSGAACQERNCSPSAVAQQATTQAKTQVALPAPSATVSSKSIGELYDEVLSTLNQKGVCKPKKMKGLTNTVKSILRSKTKTPQGPLADEKLSAIANQLIKRLQKEKKIATIDSSAVRYSL